MATYWTLSVYVDSAWTEKALADWGIRDDFTVEFCNKSISTLSFTTTETFDAAAQFGWKAPIRLYRDRTGGPSSFSGGTLVFQGFCDEPESTASGGPQNKVYCVRDIWWRLQRQTFKQPRRHITAISGTVTTYVTSMSPEVYLGEIMAWGDTTLGYQTIDQQIVEILNVFNEFENTARRGATQSTIGNTVRAVVDGDLIQVGTIDSATYMPKCRNNSLSCMEAIAQCLRWCPDYIAQIDYTTTPPTFNLLSPSSQPAIAIDATQDQMESISLTPKYERQPDGVYIHYQSTQTVDGSRIPTDIIDKYPDTITAWTPECLTFFIEINGGTLMTVKNTVTVEALDDLLSSAAATRAAWWARHDKTVDPAINTLMDSSTLLIDAAAITDVDGNAVDTTTYCNMLTNNSTIASWQSQLSVDVVIKARAHIVEYSDSTKTVIVFNGPRDLHFNAKLTNATAKTYSTVQYSEAGDAIPDGLAESVYSSLAALCYQGRIPFVDSDLRSDIAIGNVLTLTGPDGKTYSNCLVQGIAITPCEGRMEVSIGPSAKLDASGLVEIRNAARFRSTYRLPSGRADGGMSSNATVDGSAGTASQNTYHGNPQPAQQAVIYQQAENITGTTDTAGTAQIFHDAKNEKIFIQRLDTSGSPIADAGIIAIGLRDLDSYINSLASTADKTAAREIKLRVVETCTDAGKVGQIFLCSDTFELPE